MTVVAFKKPTGFFLSGTGNSFRAARWLVEAARERGIEAETVAIILTLYSLLWGLTRIPPVRWLLSVLNPTRYYRLYHEPETSRRDLAGPVTSRNTPA